MKIYNVYQSGKRLYIDEKENPDNKIVVNKYDNMQQTLRLVSDGTLPPRLYWALRNPKLSNKYFILKLINNEDLIVGTDISATHGLWDMLLIGTDEDYIIEGTDIDQSRLTYVSDHFGRLFVRDNFLEELDFEEQCSPTFKIFYDEIMFSLENKAEMKDIPDQLSDLENDTNFISGVALKDDGEGHVEIIGTTFSGGETEEGEIPSGSSIEVDDKLDEESTNPVQNKVVTKEIKTLKDKDESLDKKILTLREENEALEQKNAELESSIEKLQIKQTTDKAPFHHITDSANMKVVDFGMEGKTEQDGIPTPENQVDIENAGVYNEETGRYEHKFGFVNKNHWDAEYASDVNNWVKNEWYDYLPIRVQKGATISVSYNQELNTGLGMFITISHDATQNTSNGKWLYHSTSAGLIVNKRLFVAENDYIYLHCHGIIGIDGQLDKFMQYIGNDLQIEIADAPTEFTEHQSQPFTLTSPVPLTKWDYLTKRDGVWGWSIWSIKNTITDISKHNVYGGKLGTDRCRVFVEGIDNFNNGEIMSDIAFTSSTYFSIRASDTNRLSFLCPLAYVDYVEGDSDGTVVQKFKDKALSKGFTILYQTVEEQSFHPLPDEEQELLRNIEMYYGVTNLYNEQGCPCWLCYTCDSKLYVDQKLEQINNALLSLGANV